MSCGHLLLLFTAVFFTVHGCKPTIPTTKTITTTSTVRATTREAKAEEKEEERVVMTEEERDVPAREPVEESERALFSMTLSPSSSWLSGSAKKKSGVVHQKVEKSLQRAVNRVVEKYLEISEEVVKVILNEDGISLDGRSLLSLNGEGPGSSEMWQMLSKELKIQLENSEGVHFPSGNKITLIPV